MEASGEEMRGADYKERPADAGARAETERGLDMLDRKIGFTGPKAKDAARIPAAGKAWIECERAVDQGHHGIDILAEGREREGGIGEDARVVPGHLQRPPPAIGALTTARLQVFAPAV